MADQMLGEADFLRDLQEFVREKWKNNPCDRCRNFSWAPLPGNATVLRLTAQTPHGQSPSYSASSYGVEFIPVYCDNCGNTVVIYSGIFDEWRKRRQAT